LFLHVCMYNYQVWVSQNKAIRISDDFALILPQAGKLTLM